MTLDQQVGTQLTIEGTARNAMAGAVVLTADRTPIYVDGLERWDLAFDGKRVSACGTLRKRGGDDVVDASGVQSTGISGDHFVLEQPSWTLS
ncbi:MAG: hypothetical protein FJ090_19625 [Deltaproteobacteria bacterium]|nr:hypothetical protein [Deltaproteobacteria bacterium]